jgi:hypothetical protein
MVDMGNNREITDVFDCGRRHAAQITFASPSGKP